jgi:hypothetical protein
MSNKTKQLPNEIPDDTEVFQLDVVGRITKRRFLGEFKCKIPTMKTQGMIGRHEAMLNGEYSVYLDAGVKKIHKMIAYLRFTLIDTPLFWRESDLGYELRDDNVVEEVYDKVMAFEDKWLRTIWSNNEESSEQPEEGSEKES